MTTKKKRAAWARFLHFGCAYLLLPELPVAPEELLPEGLLPELLLAPLEAGALVLLPLELLGELVLLPELLGEVLLLPDVAPLPLVMFSSRRHFSRSSPVMPRHLLLVLPVAPAELLPVALGVELELLPVALGVELELLPVALGVELELLPVALGVELELAPDAPVDPPAALSVEVLPVADGLLPVVAPTLDPLLVPPVAELELCAEATPASAKSAAAVATLTTFNMGETS